MRDLFEKIAIGILALLGLWVLAIITDKILSTVSASAVSVVGNPFVRPQAAPVPSLPSSSSSFEEVEP